MGKFNYFSYKEKRLEKFSQKEQEDLVFDLINAFALANNPFDSALLLQDLLTEDEIKDLAKRLRIAKLLIAGSTHEQIVEELHCSFATVTKVRIWLDNAGDGFKKIIKKLPPRRERFVPKKIPGVGYGLLNILSYYVSTSLKEKEKKRLANFLGSVKVKTSVDKDLKEEVSTGFRSLKSRR